MTIAKDAVASAGERRNRQDCKRTRFMLGLFFISVLMLSYVRAGDGDAMSLSFNLTPSPFKAYAVALGQRLLKAGKERIVATGSLAYAESLDKPLTVEVVWQYPLKVRLTQDGLVQTFDRFNAAQKLPVSRRLAETIQVLMEDSAEGLLALRSTIGTARFVGSGFKLANGDAKRQGIDIVKTSYADVFRDSHPVVKTYWFDSETKLLGFVGYLSASGEEVNVIIDDWRDLEGEKVPFLIERWENGKLLMRLTLSSATVMAGTEDGTFGGN